MPYFGPRILGVEEHAKQATREVGGGAYFGPRVTGVPRDSAAPVVVANAPPPNASDTGLSIEQFSAMLTENVAFLDALYVQELERPEGPRRACLLQAQEAARALMRTDILAEIATILTEGGPGAPADPSTAAAAAVREDIARIEALDRMDDLKREAATLQITAAFRSKREAKDAIIRQLRARA